MCSQSASWNALPPRLLSLMSGLDGQKAYVGPQTEELISHDIPLVFKRPITKTYKALRVTKRQTSIRAWPHCDLRAQLSTK